MAQNEGVVAPGEMSGDGSNYVHSLGDEVLLSVVGARCKHHVVRQRKEEVQGASLSDATLRAELCQLAKGSCPSVQLNMSDVQEKVRFWVRVMEGSEVTELRVMLVGVDEL